MSDSPDEIQWHPAFCAATGLELQENMEELVLTNHAEVEDIRSIMDELKYTAEQAMDLLKIPPQKRSIYISKL